MIGPTQNVFVVTRVNNYSTVTVHWVGCDQVNIFSIHLNYQRKRDSTQREVDLNLL